MDSQLLRSLAVHSVQINRLLLAWRAENLLSCRLEGFAKEFQGPTVSCSVPDREPHPAERRQVSCAFPTALPCAASALLAELAGSMPLVYWIDLEPPRCFAMVQHDHCRCNSHNTAAMAIVQMLLRPPVGLIRVHPPVVGVACLHAQRQKNVSTQPLRTAQLALKTGLSLLKISMLGPPYWERPHQG